MSVGPVAPPPGPGPTGLVGGVAITPSTGSGLPAPTATTPTANAPQSSLAVLIGADIAAQDSVAPLLADLAAALSTTALPAAARATAQQILNLQAPLDSTVTGEALRTAVSQSGLFLEAGLGAALTGGATAAPNLLGDLKALLLRLPADLAAQSEVAAQQAAPSALGLAQAGARRTSPRPPPPVADGPTSGQQAAPPSIDQETMPDVLRHILTQEARSALARLELMQAASLPKPDAPARWAFDLPIAAAPGAAQGGAGVAQFEISRDGKGTGGVTDAEPVWRARFSLDLEGAGPVHAEVALHSGRTRVTLWAERDGLLRSLGQGQADLVSALAGPEGGDAAVRILPGAPPPPAAGAGQLVNRTS